MQEQNKIYLGDCLLKSGKIQDGSVDLILTDLPYGIAKTLGKGIERYKNSSNSKWDEVIEPKKIYEIANRILRKNGKMVLFAQQPFTTQLINDAIPNLPHCYNMYWDKLHFANCLSANKAPVSYIEDILVFNKTESYSEVNPLKSIMYQYAIKYGVNFIIDLFKKEGRYSSDLSARVHSSYKFGFNNGMRFDLMDKKMYEFLSIYIDFKETYENLKAIDNQFKEKYASTFNLWEGKKYKSNILEYKKDYTGLHPCQKPILLLEDLVKTFSNENNLVVDLTMGSASTIIACINTNRNYIGIEKDEKYYDIAIDRVSGYIHEI